MSPNKKIIKQFSKAKEIFEIKLCPNMKKAKREENTAENESSGKKKLKTTVESSVPTLASIKPNDLQDIQLNYDTHRLRSEFFNLECLELSKKLLNKYLVRKIELETKGCFALAIGKIVETEAYLGGCDKASHTFNNKQTDRLKAMYMTAGTAYVYNIYGMYCCLNISAKEPGAGVLIRALEPCYGSSLMRLNRSLSTDKKLKELANGPSKLCIAMAITKNTFNQVDLSTSEEMWLQDELSEQLAANDDEICCSGSDINTKIEIVAAKRIGIDYAGEEAINKLYRFYVRGNKFVSVKSKLETICD